MENLREMINELRKLAGGFVTVCNDQSINNRIDRVADRLEAYRAGMARAIADAVSFGEEPLPEEQSIELAHLDAAVEILNNIKEEQDKRVLATIGVTADTVNSLLDHLDAHKSQLEKINAPDMREIIGEIQQIAHREPVYAIGSGGQAIHMCSDGTSWGWCTERREWRPCRPPIPGTLADKQARLEAEGEQHHEAQTQ